MLDYHIVIPSFNRCDTFGKKTYAFLERHKLLSNATLFLQTDEDEEAYKKYNIPIIRSPLGLCETLNFIYDYYEVGFKLWLLHDDVTKFINLENKEPPNLPDIVTGCFNSMLLHNANLAGFYPTANTFYMKPTKELSTDCKFIYDPCCLIINQRLYGTKELQNKGDFERTVLYYKRDNIVLRFNHFAFRTVYNPKTGGGYGYRCPEVENEAVLTFQKAYPEFVRQIKTHKTGKTSLVLKTPKKEGGEGL
tara:strand:+ start:1135 stop:1881 length:747 start_codon:yes stop_codon:yes gene_type:complete